MSHLCFLVSYTHAILDCRVRWKRYANKKTSHVESNDTPNIQLLHAHAARRSWCLSVLCVFHNCISWITVLFYFWICFWIYIYPLYHCIYLLVDICEDVGLPVTPRLEGNEQKPQFPGYSECPQTPRKDYDDVTPLVNLNVFVFWLLFRVGILQIVMSHIFCLFYSYLFSDSLIEYICFLYINK